MQVTETRADGLKREYRVVVPVADLAARLNSELETLRGKVRINGFRPGKVPTAHLRRVYGRSVMADVVQNVVSDSNRRIVDENGLKLAMEPQIKFPEDKDRVEQVMDARADLEFDVAVEVLPSFDLADVSSIKLTRETAPATDADVDAQLEQLAKRSRPFADKGEDAAAENGDRVTIDFVGTIDGEAFPGGSGEGVDVELGSGSFIPGFEEQLLGAKAGEARVVDVTFPTNYMAEHLAGRAARFDVTVKAVAAPGELAINDDMAKGYGFESLEAMREAVKGRIEAELAGASRQKLKRTLLDALDETYTFPLPESLVEQEFAGIWRQVEIDLKQSNKSFADENTTEEAARADYRRIAERRVRLGLVLADIGEKAGIKVSDEEVSKALVERARQYPGQEKQVWEFYRKNPAALGEIRAPIYEDKVVDHLLTQAQVEDREVDRATLLSDGSDTGSEAGSEAGDKPAQAASA